MTVDACVSVASADRLHIPACGMAADAPAEPASLLPGSKPEISAAMIYRLSLEGMISVHVRNFCNRDLLNRNYSRIISRQCRKSE